MMQASRNPNGLRFLENLAYLVPGYHGYRLRTSRREEDSRWRARVHGRIRTLQHALAELRAKWAEHPSEPDLSEVDRLCDHLAAIDDAVRLAPHAQWRFFETEILREEIIERTLEGDLLVFQDLDEIANHAAEGARISGSPRRVRGFARALDQQLQQLEGHLIMRERILSGA